MSPAILEVRKLCLDTPGGRPLFRDLDLCLGRERVALIGRNGVGKSTLLEVLAGREQPRHGEVTLRGRSALVRQVLRNADSAASPGERRRRLLSTARRSMPDLLLLDEPTRDLDADGVRWLCDWTRTWPGALIVVTHDRRLLRQFDQYWIAAESGCRAFVGSYDELVLDLERREADTFRKYEQHVTRLEERERHNATLRRRRECKKNVGRVRELGRCPSRIRLNGKRGYKQVSQGTRAVLQRDRISAMRQWVKATRRALSVSLPMEVVLPPVSDDPRPAVTLSGVSVRTNERTILADLDLQLGGERIGVTGANGAGKSTLLSIVTGRRAPDAGKVVTAPGEIGFIAQNADNWRLQQSLLEHLWIDGGPAAMQRAAQVLAAHRFPIALAERPLSSLSPGERVRAALICIFQQRPTIRALVLDEPSDDLDLVATNALTRVLAAWRGGLLVASHDTELLDEIQVTARLELDGCGGHRWR